jgi:hypothetical protein
MSILTSPPLIGVMATRRHPFGEISESGGSPEKSAPLHLVEIVTSVLSARVWRTTMLLSLTPEGRGPSYVMRTLTGDSPGAVVVTYWPKHRLTVVGHGTVEL